VNIVGGALRAIIAVVMIVGVVAFGVWLWRASEAWVPGAEENKCVGAETFVVKANETVQDVADNLQKVGLVDNSYLFVLRLRLTGNERKLQAGTFEVECGKDYDTVIRVLTTPIGADVIDFQVIEGWRLEEIAENLGAQGIISPENFLQRTTTHEGALQYIEASEVLTNAGIPADKGLEGFLFPDTYQAKKNPAGENSDEVIKRMLEGFENRLRDLSSADISADVAAHLVVDRPATLYDVITLASIVQREAALEAEMPDIAQVYWNRLAGKLPDGAPPYLNADPTIQYALGEPGNWWRTLTLDDLQIDDPYNSYKYERLPPGPISNPGLAAIRAAFYPSEGDYLYFVAKCDDSGGHYFAKTLEEQSANQALCP
jgi:UPF0755 protein